VLVVESDQPIQQESIACPICQRPLRRTLDPLISAFECEQCGPFSDFSGMSSRIGGSGSNQGPGGSGSD
jgi:hypothetical protein